ncbi:hypothetical protein CHS0354_026094 [Potamilus streckersoni]|uniref:Sacsin n=1 Tax=Potamilus streckersoni TaxID=2493646 RepID=A0AAE0S1S9_9BIVA|nr:hypothetical protein CHS0354_026094 [Potamilus streckersoni]
MLLIDPFQEENGGQVCVSIDLSDVKNCKLFSVQDILVALDGIFGLSKSTFEGGQFLGTIFWFHLREKPSALSDTIYDRAKVLDLFKTLQLDSTHNLLFLKNLVRLEVFVRKAGIKSDSTEENDNNGTFSNFIPEVVRDSDEFVSSITDETSDPEGTLSELVFKLEVVDDRKMLEKRKRFISTVECLGKNANSDIVCHYNISFKAFVKVSKRNEFNIYTETWMVLNLFKVAAMSQDLKILTQNKVLSYRPYVSVATPLKQNSDHFKGHVFCFLPLPQEPKSITGLPVHLNAFFALSQNRRHIKWPSANQEEKDTHKDRDLVWNQLLLSELLPNAYSLLLRRIVSSSEENLGYNELVHTLYASIPDIDKVEGRWVKLAECLLSMIANDKIFYTNNIGGQWLHFAEAVFINFDDCEKYDETVIKALENVLVTYNQNYAPIPKHVHKSLSRFMNMEYLTPEKLSRLLSMNQEYNKFSSGEKLNLLTYFFCHHEYVFLKDLDLLPLKSGSFTIFSSNARGVSPVYIMDEDTVDLFPGLESKLVLPSITNSMQQHFQVLLESEDFQIQKLGKETVACLLQETILLNSIVSKERKLFSGRYLGECWMEKTWKYIVSNKCIDLFIHIPLVPLLNKFGDCGWNEEVELLKLTDKIILKEVPGILQSLPEGVCDALSLLSIKILPSLPAWLSHDILKDYVYFPTSSSLLRLLDCIQAEMQINCNSIVLEDFNGNCSAEARKQLVSFLITSETDEWTIRSRELVRELKLFTRTCERRFNIRIDSSFVSLSECNKITQVSNIPVRLSAPIIVATPAEAKLALHLGAEELDSIGIVIDILKNIAHCKYCEEEVNILMTFIFENFILYKNEEDILHYLQTIPFLKSRKKSSYCRVGDLFDPNVSGLQHLFLNEDKFPETFSEEPYLNILSSLGLKSEITFDDLIETAKTLDHMSSLADCKDAVETKAVAFMRILEIKIKESDSEFALIMSSLENLNCILAMKEKPDSFPEKLQWFVKDTVLYKPSEVQNSKYAHLVGSVMPLTNCDNCMYTEKWFKWNQAPPYDKVLKQLQYIIETYQMIPAEEVSTNVNEIYKYLNEMVSSDECSKDVLKDLQDMKCLLVNSQLMKPVEVVINLEHSCSPYLHSLDQTVCKYKHFLAAVGVRENYDVKDVLKALKIMRESICKEKLTGDDLRLWINLLSTLKDTMLVQHITFDDLDISLKFEIFAPDIDCIPRLTSNMCLYDKDGEINESLYVAHGMISQDLATNLGIRTKKTKLNEINSIGMAFGQKENLATRIKNLLSSYPCGMGIVKELLQNADDAGATEVFFIKDYRCHSCEKIFDGIAPLQGPALCVYNNSSFTKEDIEGIQNLGLGSKRSDPSKVGQYGIGFNSVYHLTDIPSFISKGPQCQNGGALVIFDPLCKYVPYATKERPGRMFNLDYIESYHPNILLGYNTDLLKSDNATMFRFPLRTAKMAEVSEISVKEMTTLEINKLLEDFRKEIYECLLFLKHITRVNISNISTGILKTEYTVEVHLSKEDEAKRQSFGGYIREFSGLKNLCVNKEPQQIDYTLSLKDNEGNTDSYYVVQRIGFGSTDNHVLEILEDAFNKGHLYYLPAGGVAMSLEALKEVKITHNSTSSNFNHSSTSKAFCFLPLEIETGMPLHINGHFILDQGSRRHLWNEKQGFRRSFNEAILENVVAPAYVKALEHVKKCICKEKSSSAAKEMLKCFHSLFPLFSKASNEYWRFLTKMVYRSIRKEQHELFVIEMPADPKRQINVSMTLKWVSLSTGEEFNPPVFNNMGQTFKVYHHILTPLLKKLGLKLLDTPDFIFNSIRQCELEVQMIDPDIVSRFLCSYKRNSANKCRINEVLYKPLTGMDIDVKNTNIETIQNANIILHYLEKVQDLQLEGLPLLVTEDGCLREFTSSKPVFLSRYSCLFQRSADKFIHHLQLKYENDSSQRDVLAKPLGDISGQDKVVGIFRENDTRWCANAVFKILYPADVTSILSISLESKFRHSLKLPWDTKHPSQKWIERFWHMLCDMSSETKEGGRLNVNRKMFRENASIFGRWSLLPVLGKDKNYELLPIENCFQVVDIDSFKSRRNFQQVLKKISSLVLISDSLRNKTDSGTKFNVVSAVSSLISSDKTPGDVLRLLHTSKSELSCLREETEYRSILQFLSSNLDEMLENESLPEIRQRLMDLPLYPTHYTELVTLVHKKSILILHDKYVIPKEGIYEWTVKCGFYIIKGFEEICTLCKRLRIGQIIEPYDLCHKYLDTFDFIPQSYRIQHLRYIRDVLLEKSPFSNYKQEQQKLISKLKESACIRIKETLKKASEFYSRNKEVFKLCCRDTELLPDNYCSPEWIHFMQISGLITAVADHDLIRFATQMELNSNIVSQHDLELKSKVLVRKFLQHMSKYEHKQSIKGSKKKRIWTNETKSRMSTIRFIVRHSVKESLRNIHKQHGNIKLLICYSGAVSMCHENICWTTMNLLPDWACPADQDSFKDSFQKELGICQRPPLDAVVQHLINICENGKANLVSEELMGAIYESLNSYENLLSHLDKLSDASIIHIPEEKQFVKPNQIFTESNIADLRPYIFKAPIAYGKYFKTLFRKLGVQERPTFHHFLMIFQRMKYDGFDFSVLCRVIHTITLIEPPFTDVNDVLFLPNTEHELVDSRILVVSDNNYLEKRLGNQHGLEFFIKLRDLGIQSTKLLINRIPQALRPLQLSKIVQEQIDEDDIVLTVSELADRLENYIHSQEFLRGILRLANHVRSQKGMTFQERECIAIVRTFQNTSFKAVKGLKSYLVLNNQIIPNTGENKTCFYRKNEMDIYIFYIVADITTTGLHRVLTTNGGLANFIDECTENALGNNIQYISALFNAMCKPEQIQRNLDQILIDAFEITGNVSAMMIPRPGTYLCEDMYSLLNQDLTKFSEQESVPVVVEENETGTEINEPKYIFCRVLRRVKPMFSEIPGSEEYAVDIDALDKRPLTVQGFKLYKLLHQGPQCRLDDWKIVPQHEHHKRLETIIHQIWNLPERDRRTIIKRMWLHLDPCNQEEEMGFCSEMRTCLEHKLLSDDKYDPFEDNNSSNTEQGIEREATRTWFKLFKASDADVSKRALEYSNNWANQLENRGNPIHDERRGQTWLQQAITDLIAAETFLPVAGNTEDGLYTYSWICFMCHRSTEKALKAAWYFKDAREAGSQGHNILELADGLGSEIVTEVRRLDCLLGHHTRTQYPADYGNRLPATDTAYSNESSEKAIQYTRLIVNYVKNTCGGMTEEDEDNLTE